MPKVGQKDKGKRSTCLLNIENCSLTAEYEYVLSSNTFHCLQMGRKLLGPPYGLETVFVAKSGTI